jgi:protoporphyrinogen/coproporphyrinogen III oxidase
VARIAIIGGGLAGLVSAWTLLRTRHSLCVLEGAEQLGGQISTERSAGYVIEHGAEGFVAKSEVVPRLAHRLGIGTELIHQLTLRSLGYSDGALHELAPGEAASMLGFQVPRADTGAGIRSLRGGMGSLIEAADRALAAQVELRRGFRVTSLTRTERGYRLRDAEGVAVDAERVVIATPARAAARLLAPLFGSTSVCAAGGALAQAKALSSVTVSLAFERSAVAHALDASGFVVADTAQRHGLRACAFVSSKLEARAPHGKVCLRAFFRPSDSEVHVLADATYAQRALQFVGEVLGIDAPPERTWVSRWPDALPVHDADHRAAVTQLETSLSRSGIALAGAAFHGAGIEGAVKSALAVAERL